MTPNPRTVEQIVARVDEIHGWDVTGERECELMRWVPPDAVPRRAAYRRDKGDRGEANLVSAGARAGYLLQRAEELLSGTYDFRKRQEASEMLIRAEEALWVAGADEKLIEASRGAHREQPRDLLRQLHAMQRTVVPR